MPGRYKQTAMKSTGGTTPRPQRMQLAERVALELDIAKFREHTDDSDSDSLHYPEHQLEDSDVESRPEEENDFGSKASLTLPEYRLRGTSPRPFPRLLPISHMLSSDKWKPSTDSAVIKTEVKPKEEHEEKPKDEKPKDAKLEEKPKEQKPSFANQKHNVSTNLGVSLEVRLTAALAAFCFLVLDTSLA